MTRKILNYLKKWSKNKYWLASVAVILILVISGFYYWTRPSSQFETAEVSLGDITQTVSITGTVSPIAQADLAFAKNGIVAELFVTVGDKVQRGDPLGRLDTTVDTATWAIARATYDETVRGLRQEETAVEQAKLMTTETALINAQTDALTSAQSAYTQAQNAIFNYSDQFFANPQSVNPTITLTTASVNTQTKINQARRAITYAVLIPWANKLAASQPDQAEQLLADSYNYLTQIKTFMDDLSLIVNELLSSSQSTINTYVTAINNGQITLNQAVSSVATATSQLQTALTAYYQTQSSFSLKLAGNSEETVSAQLARVNQAAAELAKDTIRAPLNGQVSRVVPTVGEFVSVGENVFSVIGNEIYKIEANVPEADIAKIKVGDLASTTLDAYGSNVYFDATVALIDPAQTVLEGVSTYKVTLYFTRPDSRIRSGMTANLDILTASRRRVLTVPYRALIDNDGHKTVRVADVKKQTFRFQPVTVGLKGSDGLIEILTGLTAGQRVVTYLKP